MQTETDKDGQGKKQTYRGTASMSGVSVSSVTESEVTTAPQWFFSIIVLLNGFLMKLLKSIKTISADIVAIVLNQTVDKSG